MNDDIKEILNDPQLTCTDKITELLLRGYDLDKIIEDVLDLDYQTLKGDIECPFRHK